MKLYLVHGNTWFYEYGSNEVIFGIFTSPEEATRIKLEKEEEYFQKESGFGRWGSHIARSAVEFEIEEIEVDVAMDLDLGGYIE